MRAGALRCDRAANANNRCAMSLPELRVDRREELHVIATRSRSPGMPKSAHGEFPRKSRRAIVAELQGEINPHPMTNSHSYVDATM